MNRRYLHDGEKTLVGFVVNYFCEETKEKNLRKFGLKVL